MHRNLCLVWSIFLITIFTASAQAQIATPDLDQIPSPAQIVKHDADVVTFMLLGSDTTNPVNAGRTDVILVIAVNPAKKVVSLLSIPRDLYVFIPGWSMQRINTTYGYGERNEPGAGASLLIETIRYNLGLEIDYYARVDFNGFKEIIDAVGGVEIAVDCAIEDWQLKEPDLDPTIETNWQMMILPIGVHQFDGDLALWYVRSRRTSSDFDRGRRQQTVMRALWQNIRSLGLLDQLTDLWPQMLEIVDTNVPVSELAQMLPLAATLNANRISTYPFRLNHEVVSWLSPEGSSVLLPVPDEVGKLMSDFLNPLIVSQSQYVPPTIQIINASGNTDLPKVAADRLAWEGFAVSYEDALASSQQFTTIRDFTGQVKGSRLHLLKSIFRVSDQGVKVEPDPNRAHDYEIILGRSYYPCTYDVLPPASD